MSKYLAYVFQWNKEQAVFYDSAFNSALCIGAVAGVLFTWISTEKYGRTENLIIVDAFIVAGTLLTLIESEISIIFGRILIGFGVGINTVILPIYLREISTDDIRGIICGMQEVSAGLGTLMAYMSSLKLPIEDPVTHQYVGRDNWWRVSLSAQIPMAILRIFLLYFVLKLESPLYLYLNGQENEAQTAVAYLVMPDKVEEEILQLHYALESKQKEGEISFANLFKGESLMTIIIAIPLVFFQLTTGITAVITFCQRMFAGGDGSSISESTGRTLIIIWGILRIFSSLGGGVLLDIKGRRYLFIAGAAAIGVNLALIAFTVLVDWMVLKFLLLFTYIIIYGLTLGPVVWTFVGEVLSPRGLTLALITLWVLNFLVLFSYSYLAKLIGDAGVFLFYGSFSIFAIYFAKSMMPETAHKSRIEIRKAILEMLGEEGKDLDENEMTNLNIIHEQDDEHDGQSPYVTKPLLEKRFEKIK